MQHWETKEQSMDAGNPLVQGQGTRVQGKRGDLLLWIAMLGCGGMLTWLSIARYLGYNAGMLDLGNMAQAIWSATQGEPLIFTQWYGQFSRLSGSVEAIYLLLVPAYALWPDPRLLLIVQSVLFVLGALPVYRLAARGTGSIFAARCLALIYLFYPVAQTAVLFDFHGDTLAMPLLLFALDALERRAWGTYTLFLVLVLACKVYAAVPVAGIGAYAWLWGNARRVGAVTVAVALLYGVLAFFVIRPLFDLGNIGAAAVSQRFVEHYFGELSAVGSTLGPRILNAVVVFGPAMFLAWRGWRWLLPGLPVAAAALISTAPGPAYAYNYHHYALVVPFIVMAVIDGIRRMQTQRAARREQRAKRREQRALTLPDQDSMPQSSPSDPAPPSTPPPTARRGRSWQGDLGLTVVIVLLFSLLLVDTPLNPLFWLGLPGKGLDASQYGFTARDAVKDAFLAAEVPPGAPMAASMYVATHIANRETLYLVRYPKDLGEERLSAILPQVDYVLADALFDNRALLSDGSVNGTINTEAREIERLLQEPAFGLIAMRDGLLLFQRDAKPELVLAQQVVTQTVLTSPPVRSIAGGVFGLVESQIEPLTLRRFRARFTWRIVSPDRVQGDYVAVSRLGAVVGARMVHLPTYVLYPTNRWNPGEIVRETFEVELPDGLAAGTYTWYTGWYNPNHVEAYATDARSRLGEEIVVGSLDVRR